MPTTASATATIDPNGANPFVEVFDSPDNFGVFTLSLHDGTSGATISTLATNANSFDAPQTKFVLPLMPSELPGKVLVCVMTLVPAGVGGNLKFTLRVKQGGNQVDDGKAVINIPGGKPDTAAIRVVLK